MNKTITLDEAMKFVETVSNSYHDFTVLEEYRYVYNDNRDEVFNEEVENVDDLTIDDFIANINPEITINNETGNFHLWYDGSWNAGWVNDTTNIYISVSDDYYEAVKGAYYYYIINFGE